MTKLIPACFLISTAGKIWGYNLRHLPFLRINFFPPHFFFLKGNTLFKEGKFESAINCYTTGIQLDPTNAVLPANRAMCLLKLKRYVSFLQSGAGAGRFPLSSRIRVAVTFCLKLILQCKSGSSYQVSPHTYFTHTGSSVG